MSSNSQEAGSLATTTPSTAGAPVLSPSSSPQQSQQHQQQQQQQTPSRSLGRLQATILSAYDLPYREPPVGVRLTVAGLDPVQTGPPAQRHKDRNSFKFTTSSNNTVSISAPLSVLYQQAISVEIVYAEPKNNNKLVALYSLNQLKISETTWLILHLDDCSSSRSPDDSEEDAITATSGAGSSSNYNNTSNLDVPPTIRLQMKLEGPYRTEIAAILNLAKLWFGVVDTVTDNARQVIDKLPLHKSNAIMAKLLPDPKLLLIPAVPTVAVIVVSAPVFIGVLMILLPFMLPLLVVLMALTVAFGLSGFVLYCSTGPGRMQVSSMLSPAVHTILSTRSGQRLVYQTGPRPSAVAVTRTFLPTSMWGRLVLSLLMDCLGSSSYLLPIVGEGFDVIWGPVQTVLIAAMYDTVSPNLKYVSFLEEILPFTDILPSATVGWIMQFGIPIVTGQYNKNIAEKHRPVTPAMVISGTAAASTPVRSNMPPR